MLYLPSIRINAFKPQMEVRLTDASRICQVVLSPNSIEEEFWRILEYPHVETMRN